MDNKNNKWVIFLVLLAILAVSFIFWAFRSDWWKNQNKIKTEDAFDQSISNDNIKILYSSSDFKVAQLSTEILLDVKKPPCDNSLGYEYCIYYIGDAYEDTTLESAGMRIKTRADLVKEDVCLNTPPLGYDNSVIPNTLKPQKEVSSSVFMGLSNSGAGHTVKSSTYRLYLKEKSLCYEFETMISHGQASNFPIGTKDEFTAEQEAQLNQKFKNILLNMVVLGDLGDVFPQS